jgi:hypothetical protein
MALHKPGFIVDLYGWKSNELHSQVEPQQYLQNGLRDTRKFHLWPYVNQILLRINMVEIRNFPTAFGGSLP